MKKGQLLLLDYTIADSADKMSEDGNSTGGAGLMRLGLAVCLGASLPPPILSIRPPSRTWGW